MTLKFAGLCLYIASMLSACTLTAGPVTGSYLREFDPSQKALTILSDGPYVDQMSAALSNAGFGVVTVLPGRQPTTRYSVKFHIQPSQTVCVFTDHLVGDSSMAVVDNLSGETVAHFKQWGATGPCTTVDPVYPTLAAELSKRWKPLP